jgi:DNA repair protein RadC
MKQKNSTQTSFQIAEIELIYKAHIKASKRPLISASSAANDVLAETWDKEMLSPREQFHVILLNRANRVLGVVRLPTDNFAKAVSYPKMIFTACLTANAVAIIIGHHQPAGNLEAKRQNEKLGKDLKYFGSFLNISVLDFIITTENSYCSLADQGLL